jgi:NarL family two-component system response regulator LiaR
MSASPIRVLIADDHAVVRQGLRTFLDLQEDLQVVAEAEDGQAALAAAEREAPDVVLMDLVMPRLDGIAAIRALRERVPGARVIALTSFADDERIFPAVRAGAAGYLLKDVEPSELVRSIRIVHAGQSVVHPAVASRLLDELAADGAATGRAPGEVLTEREREVLRLIARGQSNKVIARELGVSEKTVKTHVSHILGKLGLTARTQAALFAVRHGLAEGAER